MAERNGEKPKRPVLNGNVLAKASSFYAELGYELRESGLKMGVYMDRNGRPFIVVKTSEGEDFYDPYALKPAFSESKETRRWFV